MIPTHSHSEFSALDGYSTVTEIADRIQTLKLDGCWLTDHGTVAGLLPFRKEMASRGLFAGMGIEAYQAINSVKEKMPRVKGLKNDQFHVILLAKNYKGYQNLLRLSDEANRNGIGGPWVPRPRVDWEMLEKYHEGLACTSACMGGLVAKGIQDDDLTALNRYRNIFKENFFIEIHTYESEKQQELNQRLYQICMEQGIYPLVANDAHYPSPAEYEMHELMVAIQQGKKYDIEDPHHPRCLYIMSEEEVKDHLSYLPESFVDTAIENTDLLKNVSEYQFPEDRRHLPVYPSGRDNRIVLGEKIVNFVKDMPKEYKDRALMELDVLTEAGLEDYFLIVEDYVKWARKHGIMVGPGRGSAGGSLIAWALGITEIDPIKYGLYFERFYNAGREKGLPDIDIDFQNEERPRIKDYLAKLYGFDKVLGIGNHMRFRPKSAIGRVATATSFPYLEAQKISKIIDRTTDAGIRADWEQILELQRKDIWPFYEKHPDLFSDAEQLTDRLSGYGVHASAVVISDVPLAGYIPIMRQKDKAKNDVYVTAYDMYQIEALGWPKFDLLGLKNLDVLKLTAQLAGESDFDYSALDCDEMPESAWAQVDEKKTSGVFQIEDGHNAKEVAKKLRPRSILDLAAAIALNRPGPINSGATERYLRRRVTGESWDVQPLLRPIVAETYGEIIYQENVIAVCLAMGYSLQEADSIRSIMGKKKVDLIEAAGKEFMQRAANHMSPKEAAALWGQMAYFSKYGFNKSHAVGYALIAARCLYAKWRWPVEFIMASILVHDAKHKPRFIKDARRMGLTINPPNINHSGVQIGRVGDDIYLGFSEIKNVGAQAGQWVIDNRPRGGYRSYEHFAEIHSGAQSDWEKIPKLERETKSAKQQCNARAITAMLQAGAFDSILTRDISDAEKVALEESLLGFAVTDVITPILDKHQEKLGECLSIPEIEEQGSGLVPGIITSVRKTKVKPDAWKNAGEEMAHLTIEWEGQELKLVAFPETWKRSKELVAPKNIGIFSARFNDRGAEMLRMQRLT